MPCQVDTSWEDSAWANAFREHHRKVEALLESVLDGGVASPVGRAKYSLLRQKLADDYARIHKGLYSDERIAKMRQRIIDGENPR